MNATGVSLARQSICVTCLSQERKLFPVNDSKSHASFLVNVSEDDKLCWECHFFVLKVFAFRSRAERAQVLLASALHQTNETKINCLSSLKMTPVYLEISLQTSDLLQENVKTETMKEECEDTLYECPIEDNNNSDDVPCDDSLKELDDESLLPLLNEQTEAKGDEGACSYTMDDDITNTSMKLLNNKNLLNKRQVRPCKREPGRGADATPERRHAGAGGAAARSRALQHHEHRSCFDGLQQVPLADDQLSSSTTPVTFECSFKRTHVNQQATPDGGNVLAPAEQSRLYTPKRTRMVGKSHICNTCGKHFKTKSKFNKHIMIHTGKKSFSCNICNKRFNKKSGLISHLRVHTVEKPFSCDICNMRFKHETSLTTHLLLHKGKKLFNCYKCGKQFNLKSALRTHLQTHTGEKTNSCYICNKQLSIRTNITRHLRLHARENLFCCDVCGKQMKTKWALTEHLGIHTDEKPFGCDECGKWFKKKSALKSHLIIHTTKKQFSCDMCVKRFARKSGLIGHLISHSTDKPFCCTICNKRFKLKSYLVCHLDNMHTGEKSSFSCDVCQRLFKRKPSLIRHIRLMHTLTDERPFGCDICQKRFKQKCYLVRHMRLHTGERPFGCDVCGKRFNCGSTLKAHIRIHTGEKPYSCEICGMRFNQKSPMKTHLRTHTGKKGRI